MDGRTTVVGRYLDAVERFDSETAPARCATGMTRTEGPELAAPMTRKHRLGEMEKGVSAAEAMLVEQSYEIVVGDDAGETLATEIAWRARPALGPLPERMMAYSDRFSLSAMGRLRVSATTLAASGRLPSERCGRFSLLRNCAGHRR